MLKFILVVILVILYLVLTLPILLFLWLIGLKKPHVRDVVTRAMIRWIFRVILFVSGVKVTVKGLDQLPKDQAMLYIGNHRSYFDILLTYATMPGPCGFVAKKELGKFPVFNVWMKYIHCLFLDRTDIKQGLQMILSGCEEIKNGTSIFIFPEGTRGKSVSELDMLPFHNGSFKIATKTGCPIVPVAIINSREIFEAHLPKIHSTHVTLEYGTPILPSELTREEKREIGTYTQQILHDMLQELKK
ncbi:MAG: lysophospholipid acyltransferase family protein [Fusicatenibacter sp.]|nr:1-acyl-sn-glycerol-3-phosphate acyltransferase [Fusicatenibacter sp.]MDY2937177.1 lysophospholipid acyltransferase family protein [Fusicatenibacter sp.]